MSYATAEKPIVVIDRTKDGAWLLIAGRADGDTHDSYFYATTADMVALNVAIPPNDELPAFKFREAGGVSGTYLRQMHAVAQHKQPAHPWSNRLSNPVAYKSEWVGLDRWF